MPFSFPLPWRKSASSSDQKAPPEPPLSDRKEYNFIWIGQKPLPDKYLVELKGLLLVEDCEVTLWVDDPKLEDGALGEQLMQLRRYTSEYALRLRQAAGMTWSSNPDHQKAVERIERALRHDEWWSQITDFMRVALLAREGKGETRQVRCYSELDHIHEEAIPDFEGSWAHAVVPDQPHSIFCQLLVADLRTPEGRAIAEGVRDTVAEILPDCELEIYTMLRAMKDCRRTRYIDMFMCATFGRLVTTAIQEFLAKHPALQEHVFCKPLEDGKFLGTLLHCGRSWLPEEADREEVKSPKKDHAVIAAGKGLRNKIRDRVSQSTLDKRIKP